MKTSYCFKPRSFGGQRQLFQLDSLQNYQDYRYYSFRIYYRKCVGHRHLPLCVNRIDAVHGVLIAISYYQCVRRRCFNTYSFFVISLFLQFALYRVQLHVRDNTDIANLSNNSSVSRCLAAPFSVGGEQAVQAFI